MHQDSEFLAWPYLAKTFRTKRSNCILKENTSDVRIFWKKEEKQSIAVYDWQRWKLPLCKWFVLNWMLWWCRAAVVYLLRMTLINCWYFTRDIKESRINLFWFVASEKNFVLRKETFDVLLHVSSHKLLLVNANWNICYAIT